MTACEACDGPGVCLRHASGVVAVDPEGVLRSAPEGPDRGKGGKPRRKRRVDPCPQCEQTHERCIGHTGAGTPCQKHPRANQEVCGWHGGGKTAAQELARQRQVEQQVRRTLAHAWAAGEDRPVTDPLDELARVAGEIVAFKDMLRVQVEALDGQLTYWQKQDYGGEEVDGWTKAAEDVRAVVGAYERALERTTKVLVDMVKLDLYGRVVAVREEQADALADAARHALGTVDLDKAVRDGILLALADRLDQLQTQNQPLPQPREIP